MVGQATMKASTPINSNRACVLACVRAWAVPVMFSTRTVCTVDVPTPEGLIIVVVGAADDDATSSDDDDDDERPSF